MAFVRGVYLAERVVRSGTWLYDGEFVRDVRIVYSPIRFGDYDDDDPPELREDIERDTYYVEYGSTIERGVFNVGGGGFLSVEEAMRQVESKLQGVEWLD
jgi:hypothetical protein